MAQKVAERVPEFDAGHVPQQPDIYKTSYHNHYGCAKFKGAATAVKAIPLPVFDLFYRRGAHRNAHAEANIV
jgi:hypothetical protein